MSQYFSKYIASMLLILVTLISGCETRPSEELLVFDSLAFENNSYLTLNDVRIEVKDTGAFAACSPVLSMSTCETSFRARDYQGNPVYISWSTNEGNRIIGPIKVNMPAKIILEKVAKIIIAFDSQEQLTAKFVY